MATSFGGFIASALGGAAKGYGEGAQMEMKKQAELDLKKQLLDAEAEKDLRVADINRQRINDARLADEKRVQSPAYLEAQATAAAAKFDAYINAGVPEAEARALVRQGIAAAGTREKLAPVNAAADLIVGTAAAGTRTQLAGVNAAADVAEGVAAADVEGKLAIPRSYADAAKRTAAANMNVLMAPIESDSAKYVYQVQKELSDLKLKDATDAQIAKAKALVADTGYMEALIKTDRATHQHLIDIANIRADSSDERTAAQLKAAEFKAEEARLKREAEANKPSKGPGGSANVGLELERAEKSAKEALARALGVETKEANGAYATLKRRADSGDAAAKAKLAEVTPMKNRLEAASAEWEARKKATGAAPAAAPAAAASSVTPAIPPGFKGAEPPMPRGFK